MAYTPEGLQPAFEQLNKARRHLLIANIMFGMLMFTIIFLAGNFITVIGGLSTVFKFLTLASIAYIFIAINKNRTAEYNLNYFKKMVISSLRIEFKSFFLKTVEHPNFEMGILSVALNQYDLANSTDNEDVIAKCTEMLERMLDNSNS